MPAPISFDLAKPEPWCGCRPGMTRAQVLAVLAAACVEAESYSEGNLTATQDEWEMECCFAGDGSERLCQLSLEGDAVLWAGQRLIEIRLDEALRMMAPSGPALWTNYDAASTPFPDPPPTPAPPVTDEELLSEGTIWLPERGLGLVICEGKVVNVAWREAPDFPLRFAGPVTEAQRELSRRTDLEDHLRKIVRQRAVAARPKDPMRFLRGAVTLATFAALALTAREGFNEMQLWNNATTVKARLIANERGPMKQFFEYLPKPVTRYLPQRLLAGQWSGVAVQRDLYRLEYTDPHEQQREALLEGPEFYIPPAQIGEEVDLAYLDENPPRVKGPARVRDASFIEHVPWAISIGVAWLVAQFGITILPALFRLLWRRLPRGTAADEYRPDLH